MKLKFTSKILTVMSYSFIGLVLQVALCSVLLAYDGTAQKKSINEVYLTLHLENAGLQDVIKKVEKATDFKFIYSKSILQKDVDINLDNKVHVLGDVLRSVAKQAKISFKRIDENIHISQTTGVETIVSEEIEVTMQTRVSGKVTSSADSEPLPGVSIIIKGTSSGTTTDINGSYSLSAQSGDIIQFSYIGFQTQEIQLGNQTTLNISLEVDQEQLEEVVVVGYGTQKKKDLTGSVASVDMNAVEDAPVMNAVQALQGRVAGVSVIQNTGKPGAGFLVQVRGVGTLGNTQPLFVIDGIIGAGGANSINPNDIESIEVLKDASASAIYGSRAANGVVLITTKRGKTGKPTISLNSYYGVQNAWKTLDVLNAQQYAEYANELQANAGQPPIPNLQNPSALQDVTDWQDELFQTAPIQDHNISFSGGTEKARYLFSAGYYGQEGIVRNSGFDRFSFRANSDFSIGNKLEVGESFMISTTNTYGINEAGFSERTLTNAILMPTYIPVFDPDAIGGFAGTDVADGSDPVNPIKNAELYDREAKRINILGNAYLNYEIIEGLNFRSTVSIDFTNGRDLFFRPRYEAGERDINPFSELTENFREGNNLLVENTLNYSKVVGKHEFSVLGGYTRQWFEGRDFGLTVRDFASDATRVIGAGNTLQNYSGRESDWSLTSLLGRATYSFDDKYLVTANIRRDGSSRFADGNRFGVFPSFSVGWRVSNEAFMDNVGFIDDMKIRYGWGQLGNQEIGLYPWQATLTNTIRYIFGESQSAAPAITQRALANSAISWESTTQSNVGLDLVMFNNTIDVNLEYYVRTTDDMLLQVPIARSSGLDRNPTLNSGSVENRGIDLALGFNKNFGELSLSVGGNLSYLLKNEVTSLGEREQPVFGAGNFQRSIEGEPIGHFFGYRMDRIYQTQAEVDADNAAAQAAGHSVYQNGTTSPGDIRFIDLNGDGRITGADREKIGNPIPKLNYGINLRADYKNFDFTMMLQGMDGFEIFNRNRALQWETMQRAFGTVTTVLDRWRPDNPSTTMPRAIAGDPSNNRRFSSRWMESGAFARLKLVSLGYTVPQNVLENVTKNTVSSLRVYLSGNNLLTFTNVSLWDPEFTNANPNGFNNMFRGIGESVYPQARSVLFGIQAKF